MLKAMLKMFKVKCDHQFCIDKIELTNIPSKEKPKSRDYFEWREYHSNLYDHPSIKKRVKSQCSKCGETFFADCGLNLPGKISNG